MKVGDTVRAIVAAPREGKIVDDLGGGYFVVEDHSGIQYRTTASAVELVEAAPYPMPVAPYPLEAVVSAYRGFVDLSVIDQDKTPTTHGRAITKEDCAKFWAFFRDLDERWDEIEGLGR